MELIGDAGGEDSNDGIEEGWLQGVMFYNASCIYLDFYFVLL